MKNMNSWKVFEKTGSIDAYLHYACTSEDRLLEGCEEGELGDESGDGYGDGIISGSYWGI